MTTYIESKLNPDGRTYDHSEVIEACHCGAEIEYDAVAYWQNVRESEDRKAIWFPTTKYRAVIEGTSAYEDPITRRTIEAALSLTQAVLKKFQPGSQVITLTRAEVNEVFPGLLK